jgi:YgiT-type zinc finger domain-containing protein
MKVKLLANQCPFCGGIKKAGKTTFTADLGSGLVVIRDVPATVCSMCGADWINDEVATKIEKIVDDAREKQHTVEITTLAAQSGM